MEVNGKYVSMANAARPTTHNITINYVYTPQEERKKGYASSCVSTLSQLMLDEGVSNNKSIHRYDKPLRLTRFIWRLGMNT